MAQTAPTGLAKAGRTLWKSVTDTYELRADELRILEDACFEVDLVERLKEELKGAPLQVRGSQGQDVASPLVTEIRQHRALLQRLLRSLDLPDEGGNSGRASAAGRALVSHRWARGA